MRFLFGVLLFGGFAIFVTPVLIVGMLSTSHAPGNTLSLLKFGLGAAVLFGIPGYFTFPDERRLQAVAWLALACLAYGGLLVAVLSFIGANPALLTDPRARSFYENAHFNYGLLAIVSIAQIALFVSLFRRKRLKPAV
jgi:magnesium-transporting ATPase (P-type)